MATRSGPVTVTVADDEAIVRAGIAAVLSAEPDLVVVGQDADGEGAVRRAVELRPDVCVVDIRMRGTDGIAATARIRAEAPGCGVLILTTFGHDDYVFGALRAGAAGFLLKDSPPARIVDAVRVVARGGAVVDPGVTRLLLEHCRPSPTGPGPTGLTPRETTVLTHLAAGLSNAEIAAETGLRPATVKDHVAAILGKLKVRNRVQAAVAAYESGLVRPRS
ncbi:response regulator transcription factor [Actinosynnema sp. NPDC020468]|uniref:response regulator transcription factor n=1 Tax=Actinosynnema sp. NPDC020468 TaxID=3154488 RepID=UPI0033DA05D0